MNWYDLPVCYDVSFSHEMKAELDFLKAIFGNRNQTTRLLEPACGTGRLIVPLVRAGFDCTGFDLNRVSLAYLKKNWNGTGYGPISVKRTWQIFHSGANVLTAPVARSIHSAIS